LYYLEELDYEKDARQRAENNAVYRCLFNFTTSVSFNFFIFVLIIANTATLASYHFDQSDLQTRVLELFNEFFTWTFFLEMILKIIGLGWENYRQDKYNVFDAVIVIISLVDWTISKIPNLDAGSALNAFRALRLLRMLKLSKSWQALADILRKTAKSMQEILSFSVLLFLFMYIFALLGMELFANAALVDADDNLIRGEEEI
jgi:voltage-dependent calcium channel L type alpha-1D